MSFLYVYTERGMRHWTADDLQEIVDENAMAMGSAQSFSYSKGRACSLESLVTTLRMIVQYQAEQDSWIQLFIIYLARKCRTCIFLTLRLYKTSFSMHASDCLCQSEIKQAYYSPSLFS